MRSPKKNEASVLEKFPDDWHIIVELCRASEDFRELCDHYKECATVLADLRDSSEPDARRIKEYEDLTRELEQEIRKTVDASA
jgi:hypothetical protein